MKVIQEITEQSLRNALNYDADTGIFLWAKKCGRGRIGSVAGSISNNGYRSICVYGKHYKAHRLAWLYMNGEFPRNQIDHIDGNRDNNRIENLRDVTKVLNMQNQRKPQRSNTSGFLGVSWQKSRSRWEARIAAFGVQHFLGTYKTAEEANTAYLVAKRNLHETCTI